MTGGLTEPTGLVQTPDGSLWVSDAAKGICRIDLEPAPAIVEDGAWCTEDETSRVGPTGATQLAFDAATSSIYAGEGTSAGGGIWRLRWDPETRTIGDGAQIHATPGDRVFGVAVAPGHQVDFTTKRSPLVGRVLDPAGAPSSTVAGAAAGDGAASLAYAGGDLFLAEGSGVTRIATPGAPGACAPATA
jgi:streptogramin lyase